MKKNKKGVLLIFPLFLLTQCNLRTMFSTDRCKQLERLHDFHQAINIIKKDPIYRKPGSAIGRISGVEVGDKFNFRA
jgi:hypothetical protein